MKFAIRIVLIMLLLILAGPCLTLADTDTEQPLYQKTWRLVATQVLSDTDGKTTTDDSASQPMWDAAEEVQPQPAGNTKEFFGYSITVPESLNKANLLNSGRQLLKYFPYRDDIVNFADSTNLKIRSHIDEIQAIADDLFTKTDALQTTASELLSKEHWAATLDGLSVDVKNHEIVTDAITKYENIKEPVITIINNPMEAPGVKQVKELSSFPAKLKKKLVIGIVIIVVILIIVKIIINKVSQIRGKMVYKAARFAARQGIAHINKRRNSQATTKDNRTAAQPKANAVPGDLQTEAIQDGTALLHELKEVLQNACESKQAAKAMERPSGTSSVNITPSADLPSAESTQTTGVPDADYATTAVRPKRKHGSPSKRFACKVNSAAEHVRKDIQGNI